MAVVGIDLGTTNSAIAVFTENGPKLIPNALGESLTPSCVAVGADGQVVIGRAARERLVNERTCAVASFKRFMGSARSIKLEGAAAMRAEQLSALVLGSLKADAEAHLGETIQEAIISVPAYFNDIQRKATLDAARLAGLKVERLINEPTAAALAYGLESRKEGFFLVFDLGGGTFDVSLLEAFEGVMEVRATAGDTFLGGDDFTNLIVAALASDLNADFAFLGGQDQARLLRAAEAIKHGLTTAHEVDYDLRFGEGRRTGRFERGRFEQLAVPLLERIKVPLERAIRDSKRPFEEIDAVVLVGGATRMPMVRALVTRLFSRFPLIEVDPDTTVALGAAVQAGLKARNAALADVVMTDVCPFTLGIVTTKNAGTRQQIDVSHPIIERSSIVPVSRSHKFCTVVDNQTAIEVRVLQGESVRPENNLQLGVIEVAVPKSPKGAEVIDVRFTYDINGALEVDVTALSTRQTKRQIFRNASNLSDEELAAGFANLAAIKLAPRDQAPNQTLLARAERIYEEMLGEQRDYLRQAIAAFEKAIADPLDDAQAARDRFKEQLDGLEVSSFRLS